MLKILKKIKNQFIINSFKRSTTHSAEFFNKLPQDLQNDKKNVLIAMQCQGLSLNFVSNQFKDDYDVVMAAVTQYSPALLFASDNMKNNKNIVLTAINDNGACLINASDELKDDYDVALAAAKNHGCSIEYISDRLKNNKDIVLAAVKQNGYAIVYSSDELKNDYDVALAALYENPESLKYISKELQSDYDIALAFKNKYDNSYKPSVWMMDTLKMFDIIILNEQIFKDAPINPTTNIKNKSLKF